jgi:hypothetical protein
MFLKSHPAFFPREKNGTSKSFIHFGGLRNPGLEKGVCKKGFLGDETINGYQESRMVFFCVHWCGR